MMKDNLYSLTADDRKKNESYMAWIKAGILLLREECGATMTVASICERRKLPEAEFEAVFNDLEHYQKALLDYWYEQETIAYIDAMEEFYGSAEDVIYQALELFHHIDKTDEIAIRSWALRSPIAQDTLSKVDRTRLDVVTGLLTDMGLSERQSRLKAKLLYCSEIGIEYTGIDVTLEDKKKLIQMMLD